MTATIINVRNVHAALPEGLRALELNSDLRESRNGPVYQFRGPVKTVYQRPLERVMFWPERDANPFFHLFEALWMLNGGNDVAFPARFVRNFGQFSDNGRTFHGAYGHRWRSAAGFDQLKVASRRLRDDRTDRRSVIAMWNASSDLDAQSKDIPCNTHVYLGVTAEDKLDLQVCCRSNDMVWGAYGANAVHFAFLQEYLASAIGVGVGTFYQESFNFHAYVKTWEPVRHLADRASRSDRVGENPYETDYARPFPLISTDVQTWESDLGVFIADGPITGFRDPFFLKIATPMWWAHTAWRRKDDPLRFAKAAEILAQMPERNDWKQAALEWIWRREEQARVD